MSVSYGMHKKLLAIRKQLVLKFRQLSLKNEAIWMFTI